LGAWRHDEALAERAAYDRLWMQFIDDVVSGRRASAPFGGAEIGDGDEFVCFAMRESLDGRKPAIVLTPGTTPVPLGDWNPPSDDVIREYLRRLC
jgi:hypothetical protein